MKVPFHIVQARRDRLAQLIGEHRYLPIKELCRRLGVSEATARRDLSALARQKKITRTLGGALSEFNDRFPSFRERQGRAARAKAKIARAARAFIEPGQTCFLDSGTTVCALAEAFRAQPIRPLTVVTSNLPVGEMLAAIEGVEVFQIAGQLLHLQSTLLGEAAARSIEFWSFDIAFLSAEGMDADGLWNSQAAIVAQQRVVLQRSRRHVFCIDSSKVNRKAPHFLLSWGELDLLLTDAPHEKLARLGIKLGDEHYVSASGSSASARRGPGDAGSRVETRGGDEMPVHIL